MGGISDVDTSALSEALKHSDLSAIMAEAGKIKSIGKGIFGLNRLDNPLSVAKEFSFADAKLVNSAVDAKLSMILKGDLTAQRDSIKFEADWVEKHRKYKTWEAAHKAYKKALKDVEFQIKRNEIQSELIKIESFLKNYKGKKIKDLYKQSKDAFGKDDLAQAKLYIENANTEIAKYKAKQVKKGLISTTDIEKYCDKNRTFESEVKDQTSFERFQQRMIDDSGSAWITGSNDAKQAVSAYTNGSYDRVNKSYWRDKVGCKDGELISSIIDNCVLSKDTVLRRGCDIEEMGSIFGNDFLQLARNGDVDGLNKLRGAKGVNEGFISTSFDMNGGFWKGVDLRFYAPKGTQAIYAKPISGYGDCYGASWDGKNSKANFDKGRENEVIVNRGYEYRFIKAETGGVNGSRITIYVELLSRDNRTVK